MHDKSGSRSGVLQWVVVLVVGVLVVTVVLCLNLIPRLNAGQKVLDSARPAFASERLVGARAGIDIISANVNMADPIMTSDGAAAAEVPKLIAFVSEKTGLSQAEVVAALQKNFPHTTALLQTIPDCSFRRSSSTSCRLRYRHSTPCSAPPGALPRSSTSEFPARIPDRHHR